MIEFSIVCENCHKSDQVFIGNILFGEMKIALFGQCTRCRVSYQKVLDWLETEELVELAIEKEAELSTKKAKQRKKETATEKKNGNGRRKPVP